jgi:AcrR family transcriptional regulator
MRAALELYAEGGFDETTVADIAARAGVTERTFFRYFADKREVLFDGAERLQELVVDAIATTPAGAAPIDAVAAGMEAAAGLLEERRDFARQRAAAIASNPSLQERELFKLASLAAAVAEALRRRGVPEPAASLAADAGVTVFRIGFETWIAGPSSPPLAECIRRALAGLKAVTAGA